MNTSAKLVVGIAGTLLSGKDTLANFLETQQGFLHMSTSDMLRAEKKRVYGDSPEALLTRGDPFANNLRKERGAGILVELAYKELIKTKQSKIVISGIRSIGEVEKLHELGGKLFYIDADAKLRYQRAADRNRDIQDNQTFEEFVAQESVETENIDPADKNIQNLPAMKQLADHVLYNNDDLESFLQAALKLIYAD